MSEKLYKVLLNGSSCHGGSFAWSLPTADGPGQWHEFEGTLKLCAAGYHLTDAPARWWKHEAECYEAEYEGEILRGKDLGDAADKVCVRRVRLVRKLDDAELLALNIYKAGKHVASDGFAIADGNATVRAYGNATVRAYGNATVEAYGNATVEAYGNATVEAYGNATVRAYGNATVEAYGNATVRAYGNATVRAYGNATVEAYGNATVEADGNATVNQPQPWCQCGNDSCSNKSTVEVKGNAVLIDRRQGKPVITVQQQ